MRATPRWVTFTDSGGPSNENASNRQPNQGWFPGDPIGLGDARLTGSPLFRREVLDARKEHWLGPVRLTSSRLAWPATVLGIAMMATLLLLLAFGSYTRKERVSGRLVPASGLLAVPAPIDGTVSRLLVHEGDDTTPGQPLLELSTDLGNAAFPEGVGAAVGSELQHRKEILESDLADTIHSQSQQADALRKRLDTLSLQAKATRHRLRLRQLQARKARDLLDRVRPLEEEKVVSGIQMQQYETLAFDAEIEAELAKQADLDIQRQLAEAQAELEALPLLTRQRRSGISRSLSEIAESAARNEVESTLRLRAPGSGGTVASLAVDAGQAVAKGQRLLSIIPPDSPLQAELWAPSRAVGSLSVGTRVAMRYHAFPFQRYGQRYGHVVQISNSALSADEIRTRTGLELGAPAYRIVVQLDRASTSGQVLPLRATMTLDADLLLERRRLYEFMLDPLRHLKPPSASAPATGRDTR